MSKLPDFGSCILVGMLWKTLAILRKLQSAESIRFQGTGLLRDIRAISLFLPTEQCQQVLHNELYVQLLFWFCCKLRRSEGLRRVVWLELRWSKIQSAKWSETWLLNISLFVGWNGQVSFLEIRQQVNWCVIWKSSTNHKALESDRPV